MRVIRKHPGLREELAYREGDGLEVRLFWHRAEDRLTVQVSDAMTGEIFEVEAPRDRALHVFYHPFAHALPEAA